MEIHLEERLRTLLAEADFADPVIDVKRDGLYIVGYLVTTSFEGMDEAERQALVWDRVFERLAMEDRKRILFVYTDTPEEWAAYEAA